MAVLFNHNLLSLLRCPCSGSPLEFIEDEQTVATYNKGFAEGRYLLRSDKALPREMQGLVKDKTGRYIYPVVDGIPFLTPQSFIVEGTSAPSPTTKTGNVVDELESSYHAQMDILSQVSDVYDELGSALMKVMQGHYFPICAGMDILDVGNGGASSVEIMGREMAAKLRTFVAIDKSFEMLIRPGAGGGERILGDAAVLPFVDGAFDYVLLNGVIHHLGLTQGMKPEDPVGRLLAECLRVARKGVIVSELLVPRVGELAEFLFMSFAKHMATFVYSKASLLSVLNNLGLWLDEPRFKSITDLISPFKLMPPILTLQWFLVPVFMIPYRYAFGIIPSQGLASGTVGTTSR